MSDEFDPARHKIVAIVQDPADPDHGQHLHVTVAEFRQVIREVERAAAQETRSASDRTTDEILSGYEALLRLVLTRMDEFEQRISIIEQVKVQLVQGLVA
jgi:molecular chaperone GrpE (heat shock protein)